jgi:predicted HNH restriction endonuclease
VVNPRTDLAVICADCHRMIHREPDRPLRIEEVRKLIGLPDAADIA